MKNLKTSFICTGNEKQWYCENEVLLEEFVNDNSEFTKLELGEITIAMSNKEAGEFFKPGKKYIIDIIEVEN